MTCSERSFTMKVNVQDRLSITMCAAGVAYRNNDIEVAVTCCVSLQCSIECIVYIGQTIAEGRDVALCENARCVKTTRKLREIKSALKGLDEANS